MSCSPSTPGAGSKGWTLRESCHGSPAVAVHDAWAPYDTYTDATHALCNAHTVREVVYVIDTAPTHVVGLADQAITAMVKIKELIGQAHDHGREPDTEAVHAHRHLLRSAAVVGKTATSARATKLERKHHALFTRLIDRWDDYQRFTTGPTIPWDNNPAEQTIRMPKLRIKVSGCLRTLSGAEEFAAIRSCTATAVRHGQNMLDVPIQAADLNPWTPTPPT